jgi:hypothetical protein
MAKMLGAWKPRFIHSEISKKLVCEIISQAGFPAEHTHYDVPKPRTSFPVGHLTTGVAFAFPWHRDVWYSAPRQQINWWLPVFPGRPDNTMAFDLPNFGRAVPNTSEGFDYYENNAGRFTTATQVTRERQSRPGAIDHQAADELVVLPPPGGVLLFSGAQLHTSIRNTPGTVQRRLPHGGRQGPGGRPGSTAGRCALHRHGDPGLPPDLGRGQLRRGDGCRAVRRPTARRPAGLHAGGRREVREVRLT